MFRGRLSNFSAKKSRNYAVETLLWIILPRIIRQIPEANPSQRIIQTLEGNGMDSSNAFRLSLPLVPSLSLIPREWREDTIRQWMDGGVEREWLLNELRKRKRVKKKRRGFLRAQDNGFLSIPPRRWDSFSALWANFRLEFHLIIS